MRARFAKLAGVTVAVGALVLGLAVAPAAAEPVSDEGGSLVVTFEDVYSVTNYVVSADQSKMFLLRGHGEGSLIVDLQTREIIGDSAPVVDYLSDPQKVPTLAVGEKYAAYDGSGYALVVLGTNDVEYFSDDQGAWPYLVHLVADASGNVTALSAEGEFLRFTGSAITATTRVLPEDRNYALSSGITADGRFYFETYDTQDNPYVYITAIIDMQTGDVTYIEGDDERSFEAVAFDASGSSLWGTYTDDFETLVNLNWNTSTSDFPSVDMGDMASSAKLYIDGENQWFALGMTPLQGGSLLQPELYGERFAGHFSTNFYRVPGTGDLLYYDVEMNQAGIVIGPKIGAPEDVSVTALNQSVSFHAPAEGLATAESEEEEGGGFDEPSRPFGSIWQSSPDGVTWTDIAGEDGPTLTLAATADSLQLQYRRHFLDGFWGEQNSAAARMIAQGPEITRADDLPNASAGKNYPGQIITATGQPGMTWSSADLPAGLSLNVSTGEITGTAPQAGDYEFTVTVTDDFGTDSKLFHLKVTASSVVPPVTPPTTTPLPNTGTDGWGSAAGIAAALLALGAAGLLASRRRAAALKR